MKIKNIEVEKSLEVFRKLSKVNCFKDIHVYYGIFKLCNLLDQERKTLIEFRRQLELDYFEITDKGFIKLEEDNVTPVLKKNKSMQEYVNNLNELLQKECDIEIPEIKFSLADLQPLVDSQIITAEDFYVLDKFITE